MKPEQAAPKKPNIEEALALLKEGNSRFVEGKASHPNTDLFRLALAGRENQGNHAFATILSCSDSRVPVEYIFDRGVMDIFVVRVAGNVANGDEIGSIEYGLCHVHTPVLVLLGHTQCGAVTAVTQALAGPHAHPLERNIPQLIASIKPAVEKARADHPDANTEVLIELAIEQNVWQAAENLFMASPAVRELVAKKQAKAVGAIYAVDSGKVTWLPDARMEEVLKKVEACPGKATEPMAAK